MSQHRDRQQEDPRKSDSTTAQHRSNPAGRQGEGRQNAQLGDRGASAASAGQRRTSGQGRHGGNRKPDTSR